MARDTAQVEKAAARWTKGKRKRSLVIQVLTCSNAPTGIFTDNCSTARCVCPWTRRCQQERGEQALAAGGSDEL